MIYLLLFLSGILSFFSPCMMSLIPLYVTYFAGSEGNKKNTIQNAFAFCIGFSTVFIFIGIVFSTLYIYLGNKIVYLHYVVGTILILLGLDLLGIVNVRFKFFPNKAIDIKANRLNVKKSFLFGITFALTFSPCIDVYFGTALVLVTSNMTTDAIKGGVQIVFYTLGLTVPFMFSAIAVDKLKRTFDFIKNNNDKINNFSGIFIIIMGFLVFFGIHNKISIYFS